MPATLAPSPPDVAVALPARFARCRRSTLRLAQPLHPEDMVVQTCPSVSPTKWHLAHTTWFFERFVLDRFVDGYRPYHPAYEFLFNSYYDTVGPQHCRGARGDVSRPTVEDVLDYRRVVDERVHHLLGAPHDEATRRELASLIELGVQHEQQHQELIVTDIKHVLSSNPLLPAYHELEPRPVATPPAVGWRRVDEGLYEIGFEGAGDDDHAGGFCFDNETPRHRVFLHGFEIADRLVTNGEFLAFLQDGGYDRPELWLSAGFATVQAEPWRHPMYWYRDGGKWMQYTLGGAVELDPCEPASHLSYFEADAYARWAGARLPREAEWEVAAAGQPVAGPHQDAWRFHPEPDAPGDAGDPPPLRQLYGHVWQWTLSQYEPYPGYRPLPGSLGEYNGKFMCNQFVLRGSSCATPADHARPTYRNFFEPEARWQFTGLRLARDA